jgi:hypothetical protein
MFIILFLVFVIGLYFIIMFFAVPVYLIFKGAQIASRNGHDNEGAVYPAEVGSPNE